MDRSADGRRPRILVVAQDVPWPVVTGSRIRLDNVITALSQIGDVDLFSFVHAARPDAYDIPADAPVVRSATAVYTERPVTLRMRADWIRSGEPLSVAKCEFDEPRKAFAAWAQPPYDVVWISKAFTYAALGRPKLGPTIVDLDDLEDQKIRALRAVLRADSQYGNALHARAAEAQAAVDVRRWRRLQANIASSVANVAVCSDLDAQRLGVSNATVVPNGYPEPAEPVGRVEVSDPPTILFAGLLYYPPNTDAAQWLVREVLPEIRRTRPDMQVRLVGQTSPPVDDLSGTPGVTVTGRVPEMDPELARADVVAVPIRYGSGTRVKILEAFAHRIPVVSTTLGAEGLGVVHDKHLLLADTAADFAAACVRLASDEALRARLVDAATLHFKSSHLWSHAQAAVTALAERQLALASADR